MHLKKYLGSFFLSSMVLFSVSCSEVSKNPQQEKVSGPSVPDPSKSASSSKSYVGAMDLNSTSPVLNYLAIWEGKEIAEPTSRGFPPSLGCHTSITSGGVSNYLPVDVLPGAAPSASKAGSASPPVNQDDHDLVIPGQIDLVSQTFLNNVRFLNPGTDIVPLKSLGDVALKDSADHIVATFGQSNTDALPDQTHLSAKGLFYKGASGTFPSQGNYTLHFNADAVQKFENLDLPIEIPSFEIKNGETKTNLKVEDLINYQNREVSLQWQTSGDAKALIGFTVIISNDKISNDVVNASKDMTVARMFCTFQDTGDGKISPDALKDFFKGETKKTVKVTAYRGFSKKVSGKNALLNLQLLMSFTQNWSLEK